MDTASLVCYTSEERKVRDYNEALWNYSQTARDPKQHAFFKHQMEEIRNKRVMTDMKHIRIS
jgi:hypothetical protein